ncbi:MAG: hypothetical protein ACOWWR_02590 [Eubacteriales bacterium]
MIKHCLLYEDKICNNCGECLRCDLDKNKICDNCCRCMVDNEEYDYKIVEIDDIDNDPQYYFNG